MRTKITLNDLVANPNLLHRQPGAPHCACADGEFNLMCLCQDSRYEQLGEMIELHPIRPGNIARR